jgi:CHAD domain-containing protein
MIYSKLVIPHESYSPVKYGGKIAGLFIIHPTSKTIHFETFFDTFDWRIYNAGYILKQRNKTFFLSKIENIEFELRTGFQKKPIYMMDFPNGPIKDIISSEVDRRALLAKTKIKITEILQDCLNKDQKVVCRLINSELSIPGQDVLNTISINGLRGYTSEAQAIEKVLIHEGREVTPHEVFLHIMHTQQIFPGDYSSKVIFELNPEMNISGALNLVLRKLLHIIRINESGVQNDIDTEFLHDYRVAVRRTRSVLSQLKGVFPAEVRKKFKNEFSWLGKSSNNLRDLDVYLINENRYEQLVPPSMKGNINALFQKLRDERIKEFQKFIRILKTTRYKNFIKEWDNFLNSNKQTESGEKCVLDFVKPIILNQFLTVIKKGKLIDDKSKDKQLHRLRIECKKLRYLIELFSSLFEPDKINQVVKQLKLLQDNLGEYNDYSVQQIFLYSHIEQLPRNDPDTTRVSAALGALIGSLFQKKQVIRQQFRVRFDNFASRENVDIANNLFD